MSDPSKKRRPGRPPKAVAPGGPARSTFSVRLRGKIRAELLKACGESGRSISEEIEHRLEASFERSAFHDQAELLTYPIAVAVSRSAAVMQDAPLATPRERRYTIRRAIMQLERLAIGLGVPPLEAITDDRQRQEAEKIEEMAKLDEDGERVAQERWSSAFGKWARALADTGSSPEDALEKLQQRIADESGLTIIGHPLVKQG